MIKLSIFALIVLTFVNYGATVSSCPEGSYEWQTSCYFFQNSTIGFADAESNCVSMGGHLVSFHDGFTNTLIAQKAQFYFQESTVTDFWIGLTDFNVQGNWTWMDGTLLDYANWVSDQPQNVTENSCVSVTIANGLWKSDDCFKPKPFVCKIEKVEPLATTQYPVYANCNYSFTYFEPTHSCYGYGNWTPTGFSWTQSERYCQDFGGHLASVHSYEEAQFIGAFSVAMYTNVWIGGYSNDGGNTWKWSDGTLWDYNFWYTGYPRLNTSACVQASGSSAGDHLCTDLYRFICKIPLKRS